MRSDFPRIPFTANRSLFRKIASLGRRLTDLHLLISEELNSPVCHFEGKGDSVIAQTKAQGFHYDAKAQRMYINKTQYFGPISPTIYAYRIGGYQVCDKWLKDRKERRLDLNDIRTYCRMITAIGITLEIQQKLNGVYTEMTENLVNIPAETVAKQRSK